MTSRDLVAVTHSVQILPYEWPGEPDAQSTRRRGAGTCAGKHALLADELAHLGIASHVTFMVGPLVPTLWPDLAATAGHLLEVHECLTVETPWSGPILLDVTWHPAAINAGLPGTVDWDGESDMVPAVEPLTVYALGRENAREQKELLRRRLYTPGDRALRDRTLAEIAHRARDL